MCLFIFYYFFDFMPWFAGPRMRSKSSFLLLGQFFSEFSGLTLGYSCVPLRTPNDFKISDLGPWALNVFKISVLGPWTQNAFKISVLGPWTQNAFKIIVLGPWAPNAFKISVLGPWALNAFKISVLDF